MKKLLWQARAFAISPDRITLRFSKKTGNRVFCTSIPKAGTNLAIKALCLHPSFYRKLIKTIDDPWLDIEKNSLEALFGNFRSNQIIASHLRYNKFVESLLLSNDIKHVFVIRDPRDVVVSLAYYVSKERSHKLHKVFSSLDSFKDKIYLAIQGDESIGLQSIQERYKASAGWLKSAHIIRFEDLIGDNGGGSRARQLYSLNALYMHLGEPLGQDQLTNISESLFGGGTKTFRKGVIGQWREVFDADLSNFVNKSCGDVLAQYGYE